MRSLPVKLAKHLDELLDRLARERGVSRSEVLRQALGAYAAKPAVSALDLAGDLVGAFKGLPPDLSTNPRYLKGFGESRSPRRRPNRRPA